NYIDLLSSTLTRVIGEGVGLTYTIITDSTSNEPGKGNMEIEPEVHPVATNRRTAEKAEAIEELNSMLISKYTFDNYVEGSSNKLSRTAAESVAMFPGRTFNPLFIHGASGVGKTHLINAIGSKIKQLHPELRVLYISAHLFQVQYTDSILHKNFNDFMRFYQSIDILIIDDIQEFAGLPGTQNAFFHIFNHLHLNGKQLIMTSDRSPAQLKGMEERLITRFKWGLTAEIEKPDLELRKNILRNKIRRDGLKFPEDVISYIAEHVNASVRDLEGIIVSLMAHSTINNRDVDLQLAHKIIGGLSEYEKEPISVEKIVKTVAEYYNVDVNSINTKSRKREIVLVRQTAMFLAKKHLDLSTSKIGQQIGRRDHATVLHACKTISNLLDTNKQFRSELNEIESALQTA
ncbi:MAG: chromosomal replication initiator protein DnaA, partial [Paludibacteraceae bacterium]|nr:chromosomal replication initiator protein DnaA [Paludibacteraceae bacterium]